MVHQSSKQIGGCVWHGMIEVIQNDNECISCGDDLTVDASNWHDKV